MSDEPSDDGLSEEELDGLSEEELEGHDVEELPDREAMSILRPDVTIPLEADVAADVLLDQEDDEPDED